MKTFTMMATVIIFSTILFVEIGWMTIIILPIVLFFVAATLTPIMVDDSHNPTNYPFVSNQ